MTSAINKGLFNISPVMQSDKIEHLSSFKYNLKKYSHRSNNCVYSINIFVHVKFIHEFKCRLWTFDLSHVKSFSKITGFLYPDLFYRKQMAKVAC